MGAADQEGDKSGGGRPEPLQWSRIYVRSRDRSLEGRKNKGRRFPGFRTYETYPPTPPQSLSPGLRAYVSVTRDAGGTGGRQTLSPAVKFPQRISAAPEGGAAGAPGLPEDLGPCQLLEGGRAHSATKLSRNTTGAWARGTSLQPASRRGSLDATALGHLLPSLERKSVTTNFESQREAGLSLAPQRGCWFQARQKKLLCIQGTGPTAKSHYHDLVRGVGRIGPASKREALPTHPASPQKAMEDSQMGISGCSSVATLVHAQPSKPTD